MLDIFLGEFLGTMFLIILGNGVVANVNFRKTIGAKSGFLAVTVGWGLGVFMGVIIANAFKTGGHLNPAVTAMSWVKGDIYIDKAMVYFCSEFLGAMIGQVVVSLVYWQHIREVDNKETVIGMHSTTPTHKKNLNNLFSEFVGTGVLVAVAMVLALSYQEKETGNEVMKYVIRFAGPLSMGLVVLGIGISLGGTTGYAINPARDLGPRIVYALMPYPNKPRNTNWAYAWVPVAGPLLAGVVVGVFGRLM